MDLIIYIARLTGRPSIAAGIRAMIVRERRDILVLPELGSGLHWLVGSLFGIYS